MDATVVFFLLFGTILTLIPLDMINSLLFSSNEQLTTIPSIWTLFIPGIGVIMIAIALISYHKQSLQIMMKNACQHIDQSGYGYGLGKLFMENFTNFIGNKSSNIPIIPLSQSTMEPPGITH